MFHAARWTEAFLAVNSENAHTAFLYLKALALPIKQVNASFFGHNAAAKAEKILRECFAAKDSREVAHNGNELPPAAEYAIRFICLLIERKYFKQIDSLLLNIEKTLNKKNSILEFTIEAAAPIDSNFEEEIVKMLKEKTGAAGIKIKTCIKPELLGGYLLRTDGFYIDATLKGQVDRLKNELITAGTRR